MGLRILGLNASPYIRRDCLVIASAVFSKLEHFTIMNSMLYSKNLCNNSLLYGLCVCDVLLCNYYLCNDAL
jgi:hypothetical protein